MTRILVADKLASEGIEKLRSAAGVEVEVRTGLSPSELGGIVGEFDGMIIRSAVKVTADALAKTGRLRAIARAGVGVDNIDLQAATGAGVLVMNTPDANTISTAEHTMALLLALMRKIPAAHTHVLSGEWKRASFVGSQLASRTLGIVGLGRVGRAVARRALAFDMRVLGFDPFISGDTIFDGAVKVVRDVEELFKEADCLTLHAKVTDETRNLINRDAIALMKPTTVLVNCARGELVDQQALADALNEGKLAGAAIDVFPEEPPVGNPLLSAANVTLTPHLGASTAEAQAAVSLEAVDTLLDYLVRGEMRSAVNVVGLPAHFSAYDRSFLDLACRMGGILAPWCASGVRRIRLATYGSDLRKLTSTLSRQVIADILAPHIGARLNLVNADTVAKERGLEVDAVAHENALDYPDTVSVTVESGEGERSVEGTVFADGKPRILAIDGYRMEMTPEKRLVLIYNDDRPGVIGLVGKLFGDHGINIADMTLSRRERKALMVLKLDEEADESLLRSLREADEILDVRTILLPALHVEP